MTSERARIASVVALALALTLALAQAACSPGASERNPDRAGSIDLGAALGGGRSEAGDPTAGFAVADGPRSFEFPLDDGPHPDYRVEWWYLTGNLESESGDRYGYQFTLFRTALAPAALPAPLPSDGEGSSWSTRQLYMAHLGVTDARDKRFYSAERYARGAAGLAGVEIEPFSAWLDDWSLRSEKTEELFPARLTVREGDIELDLRLDPGKPRVLQGESGWSRKAASAPAASYYYSHTRLPTSGTLRTAATGAAIPIRGNSWMDREWSTSVLGDTHVGWDWFSLQLDDGHDLMHFRLRRADGTPEPYTSGALVRPDGTSRTLETGDVVVTPGRTWSSPSGSAYPVTWTVEVPELEGRLELRALVDDQEHRDSIAYWEGAVEISGRWLGRAVGGFGYVELTGY